MTYKICQDKIFWFTEWFVIKLNDTKNWLDADYSSALCTFLENCCSMAELSEVTIMRWRKWLKPGDWKARPNCVFVCASQVYSALLHFAVSGKLHAVELICAASVLA